jgi:hypothetical protein
VRDNGKVIGLPVELRTMRAEVARALASLADPEHQVRAWLRRPVPPTNLDSLDTMVHVLYDDEAVLPDPARSVGSLLHEGDEVSALAALEEVFGPIIDRLGDVSEDAYLAAPEWPEVCRRAGVALAALVRGGGVDYPDEVAADGG